MTSPITPTNCTQCGRTLVDGQCPACDAQAESTFVHREFVVLLVLSAIVATGFVLTRSAARANSALRIRDAAEWFDAGARELDAGRAESAVRALRRAAAIDRDQKKYRIALARALVADRDDEGARQVLLGIREFAPEDPEVNLQLARLEARHGDLETTVRHYQNALYGSWTADQQDARRQVRVEFVRYLLASGQSGRALSELLILSGNLPDDLASQTEAAQLFLDAGDASRALDHFRRALLLEPTSGPALAGAGKSAFQLGEYVTARRYLQAAAAKSGESVTPDVKDLRELTELVLTRDPMALRLSSRERRERLTAALMRASQRLDACAAAGAGAGGAPAPQLEALRAEVQALEKALGRRRPNPSTEAVENGLSLVYRIEQQAQACSPQTPFDRALLLIGERHDVEGQ